MTPSKVGIGRSGSSALATENSGCVHQLQLSAAPSQGWFASFLGNPGRRYRHQDGGQKSAPDLLSSGVAVRFCPAGNGSPWQLQKTPSDQKTGCRLPCSWLALGATAHHLHSPINIVESHNKISGHQILRFGVCSMAGCPTSPDDIFRPVYPSPCGSIRDPVNKMAFCY